MSFAVMILIVCGLAPQANAQNEDRLIWEYIMLTPDKTKLKILSDNMRKHNQKYHADGQYKAYVFNIQTGDDTGKIVWQMGPLNFTDLDNRPSDNGHDDDWRDNIMPYVKHMTNGEYWRTNANNSLLDKMDPLTVSHPILLVRFMNVHLGQSHRVGEITGRAKAAVEQIENHSPWGSFTNLFQQGEAGRHVAWVRYLKSYSELDRQVSFRKAYEKAHGENTWGNYLNDLNDIFSNSWDVIFEYNKHMSGH